MPAETFRPRNSKTMSVLLYALAVLGLIAALLGGLSLRDVLLSLPVLALVGYCGYWLFWFPKVQFDDESVTLVNPVRTVTIPWPALKSIETRFALTLLTGDGKYGAWAAPAPSASSRKDSETEVVKAVRERWKRNLSADAGTTESATVRINWLQLAILLGLLAVVVICLLTVR
ncbi:hypothetical protein FHU41_001312 [Psychromicrobium silvestre]|uniref:Low molecular weight protein antigen 6 PH domain-containing protein n=1 Tax=Psychromicrobium silvestre TaxID=1645614 RepID=A0A7Y9S7G4_9MICC|nr:PH domain-containing protein [Psychromicrobium silvestre]NYE95091.1 hypothetical protein [Psychromicrobium silvestre]